MVPFPTTSSMHGRSSLPFLPLRAPLSNPAGLVTITHRWPTGRRLRALVACWCNEHEIQSARPTRSHVPITLAGLAPLVGNGPAGARREPVRTCFGPSVLVLAAHWGDRLWSRLLL